MNAETFWVLSPVAIDVEVEIPSSWPPAAAPGPIYTIVQLTSDSQTGQLRGSKA